MSQPIIVATRLNARATARIGAAYRTIRQLATVSVSRAEAATCRVANLISGAASGGKIAIAARVQRTIAVLVYSRSHVGNAAMVQRNVTAGAASVSPAAIVPRRQANLSGAGASQSRMGAAARRMANLISGAASAGKGAIAPLVQRNVTALACSQSRAASVAAVQRNVTANAASASPAAAAPRHQANLSGAAAMQASFGAFHLSVEGNLMCADGTFFLCADSTKLRSTEF